MQLGELVEKFLNFTCAGKTNETPQAYRTKLNHLLRYLGEGRELSTIEQDHIDEFKIYLLKRTSKRRGKVVVEEALSPFTIRSVLQTTIHMLQWAHKKKYLPVFELRNIEEPECDPKPIELSTFAKILQIAQEYGTEWEQARNTAILYVLRDTGGRVGSIAHMKFEHIDWDSARATVPDKNHPSTLRFSPQTVDAMNKWLLWRSRTDPIKCNNIFIGEKGGPMRRSGIQRMLDMLAKKGEVQEHRHNPHSFRHGYAREAIQAGADISHVAALLNQRNINTCFKYYARYSPDELREFHDRYSPGMSLPYLE